MVRFFLVNNKQILVSDHPIEKVVKKIGHRYEILTSVQDKSSVEFIKQRLQKSYPQASFKDYFYKKRKPYSPESIERYRQSKLGKPRPEYVRQKISMAKKGVSQFQGKRHTEETKRVMALKKLGNQHVKNTIWIYNADRDKERRVLNLQSVPSGYRTGRNYEVIENLCLNFKEYIKEKLNKQTTRNVDDW